jgi:GNAT superfamily N-acetyltransferase
MKLTNPLAPPSASRARPSAGTGGFAAYPCVRPALKASGMSTVRKFSADEWHTYRELRFRSLAESPNAFGRTLAEEEVRSDVEWAERLAAGCQSETDLPLVAEVDGRPIGLAWGRFPDSSERDRVFLFQMWVDPDFRCLGTGSTLLETIAKWAADLGALYLVLGVTCETPAMRLYKKLGFEPVGEPTPLRRGSSLLGQPMQLRLRGGAANKGMELTGQNRTALGECIPADA